MVLLPTAKRCHSAELRIAATSLPQRALQTTTTPALTSRRDCWSPAPVGTFGWSDQPFSFAFDGEGGLELDGHDIVLGEEGTTLAPWRVLDDRHLSAVRAAVDTHQALKPDLSALFDHAAKTAEPILRPLAYDFPGYEAVRDQFLLGEEILCPPVLESGAPTRPVLVAPGRPQGSDGSVTGGPAEIVLEVDLESMPYRRKIIN